MRPVIFTLRIPLPNRLYSLLRATKHSFSKTPSESPPQVNLLGDRDIEWSWVASQMPSGPGEALDFGPGGSSLSLIATLRGFNVLAVDMGTVSWPYIHPGLDFRQGDILKLSLPQAYYDLIINCSTVEHVGLPGRYDVTEDNQAGDLEAMARLKQLMKSGATMLLTIPLGQDAVFPPMCRVYGSKRLPQLLDGFIVDKEFYWTKNQDNRWIQCDREHALIFPASAGSSDALQNSYALGGFVLRKPD